MLSEQCTEDAAAACDDAVILLDGMLHVSTTYLQADEKQALKAQQAAFMTEVEEWSQGEVEALQAEAAKRLKLEQEQVHHWWALP